MLNKNLLEKVTESLESMQGQRVCLNIWGGVSTVLFVDNFQPFLLKNSFGKELIRIIDDDDKNEFSFSIDAGQIKSVEQYTVEDELIVKLENNMVINFSIN